MEKGLNVGETGMLGGNEDKCKMRRVYFHLPSGRPPQASPTYPTLELFCITNAKRRNVVLSLFPLGSGLRQHL